MAIKAINLALAVFLVCVYAQAGNAINCYVCEGKIGSGDACDIITAKTRNMECKTFLPRLGGITLEHQCVATTKGDNIQRGCSIKDSQFMKYCDIFEHETVECKICTSNLCNTNDLL